MKNKSKIYHFSSTVSDGGNAVVRLIDDLVKQENIEVKLFYKIHSRKIYKSHYEQLPLYQPTNKIDWLLYKLETRRLRKVYPKKLNRYLVNREQGQETFSYPRLADKTPLSILKEIPDVIHLHWIMNFLDWESFFQSIPDDLPIIWTLHDMNPFTGGCHVFFDCGKYKSSCHTCPQLNEKRGKKDIAYQGFRIKLNALKSKKLYIVGNSHWTTARAKESKIFENAQSFQTINLALDTKVYKPLGKEVCKDFLNLDKDKLTIFFASAAIIRRLKGLHILIESLNKYLKDIPINLLIMGGHLEGQKFEKNVTVKNLGYIKSEDLKVVAYAAADIFIVPSLFESFGQTCLEAMACATPVIGSDTSGLRDMIKHKETGLLFPIANAEILAENIRFMFEKPKERIKMGKIARKMVEQNFTLELQTKKYIELYQKVL